MLVRNLVWKLLLIGGTTIVTANDFHHKAAKLIHNHVSARRAAVAKEDPSRKLQVVCEVTDIFGLEKTFELDYGVSFSCSCQGQAGSSNALITCESDEPYCCPNNESGDITDCQSAYIQLLFAEKFLLGIPYGESQEATTRITYTAGPHAGKVLEIVGEFYSCEKEDDDTSFCTCKVTFDTNACLECTPCNGNTRTMWDCSNVASAEGLVDDTCDAPDLSGCVAQTSVDNLPPATPAPGPIMTVEEPTTASPPVTPDSPPPPTAATTNGDEEPTAASTNGDEEPTAASTNGEEEATTSPASTKVVAVTYYVFTLGLALFTLV